MSKQTQVFIQSGDSVEFRKKVTELLERGGRVEPGTLNHTHIAVDNNRTIFCGQAIINIEQVSEPVSSGNA